MHDVPLRGVEAAVARGVLCPAAGAQRWRMSIGFDVMRCFRMRVSKNAELGVTSRTLSLAVNQSVNISKVDGQSLETTYTLGAVHVNLVS